MVKLGTSTMVIFVQDKDSDIIWSQLTSRERSEFRSMIQDGRIGELVSFWQPWWVETEVRNYN